MNDKNENKCDICKGDGKNIYIPSEVCTYCNGTGEWNELALQYMNNHICQCIILDRRWCPICNEPCHHDSSQTPKCVIDPGYGGLGAAKVIPPVKEEPMEMIIR